METFEGHRALLRPLARPAVALGNFDGVHVGHQRLLAAAVAAAARLGGDAAVLTFDPHPARVLAPALAPPLITTRARKLELFDAAGIDVCILEPFTPALAALAPEAFVREILAGVLGARHVVVGYDFTFGEKRAGTTATLRALGDRFGFATEVIEPVAVDGQVASSSEIRARLAAGDLPGARLLLGRPFDVDGVVVAGAGRGRTIGVPTANVRAETELLPAGGVYAVWLERLGRATRQRLAGVANLGRNPTFGADGALSLEVHVLDFEGDLYDERVRVGFVERLRGERRFDGAEALVAQIRRDIEQARRALAG